MGKIVLGCSQINKMIAKFDGNTYNGITYKLIKHNTLQAMFEHDAQDDQKAIDTAKMIYHSDPELNCLVNSALQEQLYRG